VDGLPSVEVKTEYQGQAFTSLVGVSAAQVEGSTLISIINRLYGVGGAPIPSLADVPVTSVLRSRLPLAQSTPSASTVSTQQDSFTVLASLYDFERRANPDGRGVESNPYDMVLQNGYAYVSDAAANTIMRINTTTGEMEMYALFKEMPNPQFPETGAPTMDTVPTGLEFGPDGALYVAFLTGFPFPKGGAGVYRLVDNNGDGDALDPDEENLVVTGLNAATDVTFDAEGAMYTSEFSLNFNEWGTPGRLCQIHEGQCAVIITDKAFAPTSIVVVDGYIYFSQELAGRVSRLPLPN
jgi:hypothetical protein